MSDRHTLLRRLLTLNEGERLKPYTDTVGKLTIGVGRNLTDVGITHDEAMLLLDNDIAQVHAQIAGWATWFHDLDVVRQLAVMDLAFNLGFRRFLTFRATIAALAQKDFETAARQLEASLWYRQVGRRGPRIVAMIRTGELPQEIAA